MKLLILGGTLFLGRHLAAAALARGHALTLFHRGRTNPDLFPEAEHLLGDRTESLDALDGRTWDAVIDTCGYVPRIVRESAEKLAGSVGHYTFISSISVYTNPVAAGSDESAPAGTLEDETVEEVDGDTYGPLKALCEAAAEVALPGRTLNVRPGLIVGPHDPTDRFTYWVVRPTRGGEILIPERLDAPVQIIDVRDLAEWIVRMVENGRTGVYNATGPRKPIPFGDMLDACRDASNAVVSQTRISDDFMNAQELSTWADLPLYLPAGYEGMLQISVDKAIKAGLTFRPLPETIRDTLAWANTRPADHEWRAGLTPERETEALQAWRALKTASD